MTLQATALTAFADAAGRVDRAAERIARISADAAHWSEEMAGLLAAEAALQTTVKLVHTADEITRASLDLLAWCRASGS